jgi:hypothetical protein
MAEIVGSLFGVTPDMYERQQRQSALNEGIAMARLAPEDRAQAMIYSGAAGLGRAGGGLLGAEDPQMRLISARQQIMSQTDQSDPQSLVNAAKQLSAMNDTQGAMALIDRAKALQESAGRIAVQNAQLLKALQPAKLTGDERYIELLRIVENKLQNGQKPTLTELSNANIAGQMLSKPRSYFDQASGQMVTQAATDPSKAFPLAYKQMGDTTEGGATTTPKPTVQQATVGNIPSGSQKDIADIDANLRKLELSAPELQSFLGSLKSGEVKYNATSNTLDLLGATVLPAFGLNEQGGQVKKDEIKRALTERVNTLLLMAKGTQTEGDATRAADQIASTTTYLSQARMIGAIEGLMRTESKLSSELGVKKTALQSQGRTEAPGVVPSKQEENPMVIPTKPPPFSPVSKTSPKPAERSREETIKRFIDFNGGKPTRQEAIDALTKAGKL